MNKRVTIVYPPQHVPGMPFLAPAMLKARLKAEGLESRVIDANIDFYHHALGTNEEVREAVATMHSDFPLSGLADYLDARLIIERTLDTFAQKFEGHLGLLHSSWEYSNMHSDQVLASLSDNQRNPYIAFFEDRLDDYISGSDVVGISIGIPEQLIAGLTLAKIVKENTGAKVVVGGNLFSRIKPELEATELRDTYDVGLSNEQATAFVSIVKAFRSDNSIDEVLKNPSKFVVRSEPTPDFSDLDLDLYFSPERALPVRSGEGCYADSCNFCPIPRMSGRFQMKTPEQFLEELESHYDQYGVTFFKDTIEAHHPVIAKYVAEEVTKRELPFKLETFSNVEKWILNDRAEILRGGPHRRMMYGLETVSAETIQREAKRKTSRYDLQILQRTHELGIAPFAFTMIGIPGESQKDVLTTAETIKDMDYLAGGHLALVYHLSKHTQDGDNPQRHQELGLGNVQLMGDLAVHYAYTVDGQDPMPANKELAKEFQATVHQNQALHLMTALPFYSRCVFIDKFGVDFAREYVSQYGLPDSVEPIAEVTHARSRITRENGA
ncbi:radical SAM protein [archaeon]|mgnify:CR=1 FL=1|jgi:hypothetical protein|nr:radical SAM protein [archaeon]